MNSLKNKKTPRFKRALTIEYVLILMTIVTAFVAVILTTSTVLNNRSVDYQNYIERKRFLDEVGFVYIENQGTNGCLEEYEKNEHNYRFDYTTSYLIVRRGSGQSTVELHVELADRDGDGVREAVTYRYGA